MRTPLIVAVSPTGWWIAALLERKPPGGRTAYWNNYRLIRAHDWREAFRRAHEMGEDDARAGNDAMSKGHEFIGVTDLLPVYDKFEDGAEILFEEHAGADGDPSKPPMEIWTEDELSALYATDSEAPTTQP